MPWVLVDVGLSLLAVGLLVLTGRRLWRGLKNLTRTAREAGERIGPATDALSVAQTAAPRPGAYAGGTSTKEPA